MTQVSVTRALAECKSLAERIGRLTRGGPFITTTVGGKHASGQDVSSVEATLRGSLQSVQDLLARRRKVKAAIVRSNAVTVVVIGGEEMTVAEAIERKGSIQLERDLLAVLTQQLSQAARVVEQGNIQMGARLDQMLMSVASKDRKITDEEVASIRDPFVKNNQVALLDPNKLQETVLKLEASIDAFVSEVDFVLSESNAITKISV